MRKMKGLLLAALVAGSLTLPAAPAHASCQTELGDMCKLLDVICATNPKITEKVIAYCAG
jgi:hypothetical protein